MKNIEILSICDAFNRLGRAGDSTRLPAPVAWKRRLNLAKLREAEKIIRGAQDEIMQRYGDEEHSTLEADGTRKVKQEYLREYAGEQEAILKQDTDLEIRKVPVEEIADVEVSDIFMDTLMFMIGEE